MTDARERLERLIELAGESTPEKQRALAFELCDLLIDWPQRYPAAMREPFEALLEKVLRRLDGTTRRMIAARLAGDPRTAVTLLNEFYFDTPAEVRAGILDRNAALGDALPTETADDAPLLEAARRARGAEFAAVLAGFLGVSAVTAQRILDDSTGNALAVACKGAGIRRATSSALVLIAASDLGTHPEERYRQLCAFDDIPEAGARRVLAQWRRTHEDSPPFEPGVRAA